MAKNSKTSIVIEELLRGGKTIDEVAERAVERIEGSDLKGVKSQIKGVLAHVKNCKTKRWAKYYVCEGVVKIALANDQNEGITQSEDAPESSTD